MPRYAQRWGNTDAQAAAPRESRTVSGTLTRKAIEAAIAAGTGNKPYRMLWSTNPSGLGLRIRQNGGASWLYRYRPRGAGPSSPVQTLTLGPWPVLSPAAARELALSHASRIAAAATPALNGARSGYANAR